MAKSPSSEGKPTTQTSAAPPAAPAAQPPAPAGGDQAPATGDPGDEAPPAPAPTPAAPAPTPPPAPDPAADVPMNFDRVPREANGRRNDRELDLLLDCCEKYGINPLIDAVPGELAAWRFYPGDRQTRTPDAVVVVTWGGLKIRHYADGTTDQDTDERLRNVFGAWTLDKDKQRVPAALPQDCTLPADAVTGLSVANRHRFEGGYLRSGGRSESERRAVERSKARGK